MKPLNAKYIWYDDKGEGRNPYCMFRKSLVIKGRIKSAELNIFADTSYQLFINNEFVEFGPVRFDPRYPVYDKHDIAARLKPGRNVIAVLVNYIGHKTFKTMPARGGMVSWGEIVTEAGSISLNSYAGSWKAKKSEAYSNDSPRLSFALNAQDLFNQGFEEEGWKEIEYDDRYWPDAVELEKQDSWGELEIRKIPFMSGENVPIKRIAHVLPLERREEWYSYSIPLPFTYDTFNDRQLGYSKFYAFSTWIYSPKAQDITAGLHYETLWLNGVAVNTKYVHPLKSLRYNCRLKLKKGWNYLFGSGEYGADRHDVYLSLPRGKGLLLSADRNPETGFFFRYTPVLEEDVFDRCLKHKQLPFGADEKLEEIGGWLMSTIEDKAQSPCRESSWDDYGDPVEKLTPEGLDGHIFRKKNYPDGFSLLIDLEYNHLVHQHITMKGVRGAIIDFIYSDRMQPDGQHIRELSWVPLGDRVICSRDRIDWMPSHPRGFRYLMVTVRNTPGDVKLESLKLRSAAYPAEEKGYFRCSDACLNAIWEMGKRTQAANMEDAYDDCVDRERGMYVLDTVIQYHNNLAVFGDHALMRRCMQLYSQSNHHTGMIRAVYPNTGDYILANFGLHAIEGFYAYYMNTGDSEFIKSCWDSIMTNLRRYHRLSDERQDLLMNADRPEADDWSSNLTGYLGAGSNSDNVGINCLYSCAYLLVMKEALELAKAIGKNEDAADLEKRIGIISRSISETFWNEEKGCFKDSLSTERYTVHTNLYAVRADLLSGEKLERVKDFLKKEFKQIFTNGYDPSNGVKISTNNGMEIFEGLYKAGLYETAQSVMHQAWGWFLTQGLKTCPEHFELSTSNCHAWTASPTYYLSKNMLGIHYPKAPDLNEVEIRVKAHDIDWAEGAFPHPKGLIEVKWHMENGKRIFDHVRVPEGVKVTIADID